MGSGYPGTYDAAQVRLAPVAQDKGGTGVQRWVAATPGPTCSTAGVREYSDGVRLPRGLPVVVLLDGFRERMVRARHVLEVDLPRRAPAGLGAQCTYPLGSTLGWAGPPNGSEARCYL